MRLSIFVFVSGMNEMISASEMCHLIVMAAAAAVAAAASKH